MDKYELEKRAFNYGIMAFKNNKECSPSDDYNYYQNMIPQLNDQEIDVCNKAWVRGWTIENLNI